MSIKKLDKKILNVKFVSSDLCETVTVRGYLKILLVTLFEQGESFSGKRPFGNSGWESDLEIAFIKSGYVRGELDDDGYVLRINDEDYKLAINYAIDTL